MGSPLADPGRRGRAASRAFFLMRGWPRRDNLSSQAHKQSRAPLNAGAARFSAQRRLMTTDYRNFLALPYAELEELNLAAKADRANRLAADEVRDKRLKYLTDEKRIKAVTVLFSDLEGRLHLLDYDKKFLLSSYENLTFD